jgi:hypothetical protein
MKRYLLLTVAMVAMILATGCGGTGNLNAGPTNATINTTDGLNDAIVKFELSVSSLTLTGSGTTTTCSLKRPRLSLSTRQGRLSLWPWSTFRRELTPEHRSPFQILKSWS